MSFKSINQRGFAAMEAVLVLVIVAIIGGTGYYVYQANSKATDTQNTAQTNANTAAPVKKKYLTIKEWGVRLPYTGQDTYSYKFDDPDATVVTIISKDLANKYDCTDMGAGQIRRYAPDEGIYGDRTGPMASKVAASKKSEWGHVGNHYYHFVHDQAACPAKAGFDVKALQKAQNMANDEVSSLVPKIQAAP